MEQGWWADSRRGGVSRCRMDLPWGEEHWDQLLCPSDMLLNGSAYLVMLDTEQTCSPEFCGSRVPRMTPAPSYGQRIREECRFWKWTDQFCFLALTLASCVCLTFGKSFIFWSPVKWESSYPVG